MTYNMPKPRWWHRPVKTAASSPICSRLLAVVLHRFDRPLLNLSRGKFSLTGFLAGLPVVELTTVGAQSGVFRTVPLAAVFDDQKVILFATYFGRQRHPAWFHNLTATPQAVVSIGGQARDVIARPATPEERARYWQLAVEIYPGYVTYQTRAAGRVIPVFVLEPKD